MASSYTGLGTELMTTGENAGTWGSTTNTNLQIIEQISGGYTAQSIAGGVQTTTLSDNTLSMTSTQLLTVLVESNSAANFLNCFSTYLIQFLIEL